MSSTTLKSERQQSNPNYEVDIMRRKQLRTLMMLGLMIAVACSALAYSDGRILGSKIKPVIVNPVKSRAVDVTASLKSLLKAYSRV